MLSHDLFEGIFARAGLASDVEVVEDFPSRYDVAAKRQHRWMRGDWQLLPWIFGHWSGARAVPAVGRWKMLDNLRRSLLAPFTLATFGACWLLPLPSAALATAAGGRRRRGAGLSSDRVRGAAAPQRHPPSQPCRLAGRRPAASPALQAVLSVAFLADQAWRIGRCHRADAGAAVATRRHLLEWTTAAQSSGRPRLGVPRLLPATWRAAPRSGSRWRRAPSR